MGLIFFKGKHAGKTVEWVKQNDPGYLRWAKENAPGIMKENAPERKEPAKRIEPVEDSPQSTMRPNKNFDSESGAPTFVLVDAKCSYCDKKYKTYQLPGKITLFSYFCSDKCEKHDSGEMPEEDF